MARRYGTLGRYIARESLFSFVVAFLFFFFIFFINNMLILAEDVLSKHVPARDVLLLIVYTLPSVVSISFPFASLVGALMAVGRVSSDNELLAFQASGVSRGRLFAPFFVLGIAFTLVSFVMNDYFIPLGNINFGRLYRQVLLSNPELELESYSVKRYQDAVIITGDVDGQYISEILIIDESPEKNKRIISAERATLTENVDQRGVISLNLAGVFSHTADKKKDEFEYFESAEMDYNILLSDITFNAAKPGPREMSSLDVYREIQVKRYDLAEKVGSHKQVVDLASLDLWHRYRELSSGGVTTRVSEQQMVMLQKSSTELAGLLGKKIQDRSLHTYELEFYKKFSLPVGCLVFVLFAFPVGMFTKRSGRSVGFGIGLFVSIVYWGLLISGQTFGFRLSFSPFLSMWLPNFVILGAALVFLLLRRTQ